MQHGDSVFNSNSIKFLVEQSVDFHCHGIGDYDFTEVLELDLQAIENILAQRNQHTVLTLYLPKPSFNDFLDLMDAFHSGKSAGEFPHIAGLALEGPLLASHGGTPEKGVWMPSKQQWHDIAACGRKGLLYVIISPDVQLTSSDFATEQSFPGIKWIAKTLLQGGVFPAPGHFIKTDPVGSAKSLQDLYDIVAQWGQTPTITDHLFNDMPRNFKHAWRTGEEMAQREKDIAALDLPSWTLDNLDEKVGPVPAVMIRNARKGLVKLCQNFDGEHVDLAIVKKAVELVGAENMLMMTDSIESKRLAGRHLHRMKNSTLLYQDEGIVAAGSQNVRQQINNMISIGLSFEQIEQITSLTPRKILKQRYDYIKSCTHAQADCI